MNTGIADMIAKPGDPDLDCHLFGLRLASVVAADTGGYDAEVTLTFSAPSGMRRRSCGGGRPPVGTDREALGKIVRDVFVATAAELLDDPKPSWLVPWEQLDDAFQREVDMRIGEAVAAAERKRLTEPAGTRRCPRDHLKLGRDLAMDRIPPQYGGGWACPGILLDGSDCGFELAGEAGCGH